MGKTIVLTDPEELDSIISEALNRILNEHFPDLLRKATRKPWLTTSEIQELTSFSYRKLQYIRDSKSVRFTQIGHKIVYDTESFLQYLHNHSIQPRNRDKILQSNPININQEN